MKKTIQALKLAEECSYADEMTQWAKVFLRDEIQSALAEAKENEEKMKDAISIIEELTKCAIKAVSFPANVHQATIERAEIFLKENKAK